MGGTFKQSHVPPAGKKASVRDKPDCVPGSLTKAFAFAGHAEAATTVAECTDAIIAAKDDTVNRKGDRIKYAANEVVKARCHFDARCKGLPRCALAVDPQHVTLLQLKSIDGASRTHAVSVYGGYLFDSAEPEPLLLTPDNLTR